MNFVMILCMRRFSFSGKTLVVVDWMSEGLGCWLAVFISVIALLFRLCRQSSHVYMADNPV